MKIAFVGASGHTGYAVSGMAKDESLRCVAVAPGPFGPDDTDRLLKRFVETGHSPAKYDGYIRLLEDARPDIVVVSPWFCNHAEVAASALERGVGVYVEKPVSTTWEGYKRLKAAYEAGNAPLGVMLGIRYEPWFLAAFNAIIEGLVGEPRLLYAQKSYKLGNRPELYHKRETYGGTIPWVASHAVDWVRWLSGQEFTSVSAAHSASHNGGNGDCESTAAMLFTLTNDVFATVNADFLRPTAAQRHDDDRVRVTGSKGTIEVRHREAIYEPFDGPLRLLTQPEPGEPFLDFIRAARDGATPLTTAKDAFAVTQAVLMARDAADNAERLAFTYE